MGGAPSYHPAIGEIFHKEPSSDKGVPPFQEPPI